MRGCAVVPVKQGQLYVVQEGPCVGTLLVNFSSQSCQLLSSHRVFGLERIPTCAALLYLLLHLHPLSFPQECTHYLYFCTSKARKLST